MFVTPANVPIRKVIRRNRQEFDPLPKIAVSQTFTNTGPEAAATQQQYDKLQAEKRPVPAPTKDKENINFDEDLKSLERYFTWQADLERARNYTPLVNQFYQDSLYRIEEAHGETMLKKVERTVKGFFPKGRFPFQRDLHNQILRATLRQTLGDEYDATYQKVCKDRSWDGPKKNLFAIASRRSGKTTATASMVAALLICVPNIQIVVYSVALRTAQEFVRLVERYIQTHSTGKSMILNPGGSETLVLRGQTPDDRRRIRSFPSGGNAKNVSSTSPVCTVVLSGADRRGSDKNSGRGM
jgi:hypothetical protein